MHIAIKCFEQRKMGHKNYAKNDFAGNLVVSFICQYLQAIIARNLVDTCSRKTKIMTCQIFELFIIFS